MEYIDRRKEQIQRAIRQERDQEHWNEVHEQLLAIQKKSLEVSAPDDADEKEADAVSAKVMSGESAQIHGTGGTINRKGEGSFETTPEFNSKLESSKGSGQSLDDSTKSEMESGMGADFSGVKIHTNSEANEMNESVNAKAFTHGQDIYFGKNESPENKELLAHELVHTVQQGKGRVRPKLQRQFKRVTYLNVILWQYDFKERFLRGLLGEFYDKIDHTKYFTVEAKAFLELHFTIAKTAEDLSKLNVLDTEAKVKLNNRFAEASIAAVSGKQDVADSKDGLINCTLSGNWKMLKAGLDGNMPSLDVFSVGLLATADFITKEQLEKPQFKLLYDLLKACPVIWDSIENGSTIKFNLEVTVAVNLFKQLSKYFADQLLQKSKQSEKEKHESKQKDLKDEAAAAKENKNVLRDEQKTLDKEVIQDRKELNKLKKKTNPSPADQQRISELEDGIKTKTTRSTELGKAGEAEKQAMKDAYATAEKENRAAKTLTKELDKVEKDIAKYEKRFGERVKDISKKFKDKLNKIEERIIAKSARYIEEKLIKWVGKKVAERIIKAIAYAIPILGEILMIIDVALLIWDLAELIWEYRKEIWNWMKETAKKIAETIKAVIDKVIDYILHPMDLVKDIIKGLENLWEAFKDFFTPKKGKGDPSFTPGNPGTGKENGTGTQNGDPGTTTTGTTTGAGTTDTGTNTGVGTMDTGTTTGVATTDTGTTTVGAGTTISTGTSTTGTSTTGTTTTGTTTGKDSTSTTETAPGISGVKDTVTTTIENKEVPAQNTKEKSNSSNTNTDPGSENKKEKVQSEKEIPEKGEVVLYEPPVGNDKLNLRWHGATPLSPKNLKQGGQYQFTLVIHYTHSGVNRSARSTERNSFIFDQESKKHPGSYFFKVGGKGFRVKTDVTTVYYAPGFLVRVWPQ
ncbi:MAG: DUF4157 domain-containing protein [Bacteroidia bacterium]